MNAQVSEIAAGDGLDYHLEQAVRSNTVDAHRLLHLALEVGGPAAAGRAQGAPARGVLHARGRPSTTTRRCCGWPWTWRGRGLDRARVEAVLASDEYADEVRRDVAQAHAYGANGVPFVVVDGRYGVSGAQPVELFDQALRRAWADRELAAG